MGAVNLPPLATQQDVENMLGSACTPAEVPMVAAWLRHASSLVRNFCKQTISYVENDVLKVWPETLIADIWLPDRPLVSVISVEPVGSAMYDWTPEGQLFLKSGQWLDPIYALTLDYTVLGPLIITYNHGWPVIPDLLVDLVANKVSRRLVQKRANPEEMKGELVEGYRAYFNDANFDSLTPDEQKMLVTSGHRRTFHNPSVYLAGTG